MYDIIYFWNAEWHKNFFRSCPKTYSTLTFKVLFTVAATHFVCTIRARLCDDVPKTLHRQSPVPVFILQPFCGALLLLRQNLNTRIETQSHRIKQTVSDCCTLQSKRLRPLVKIVLLLCHYELLEITSVMKRIS